MKLSLISLMCNFIIVGLAALMTLPRKTQQFAADLNEALYEYHN